MFDDFQLAAVVKVGRSDPEVFRIPISAELQRELSTAWYELYASLIGRFQISFDPGYQPDETQIFMVSPYALPDWLILEDIESVREADIVPNEENVFRAIRCVMAFARDSESEQQVMLFQNFTQSKIIRPSWRSMVFFRDMYQLSERHGLQLGEVLSAVFVGNPYEGELLFSKVREINTYLPMDEHYREATEAEIRQVLSHPKLFVEDQDEIVGMCSPWYARRFSMLSDSGVLDNYDAEQLRELGAKVEVDLDIVDGAIALPSERAALRIVLTYLNEERYRGPITAGLYETNSRRTVTLDEGRAVIRGS